MYFMKGQPHSVWMSCPTGPQQYCALHMHRWKALWTKWKRHSSRSSLWEQNVWYRQIGKAMEISAEMRWVSNHRSHNKVTEQPSSVHPLLAKIWLPFPCCPPQLVVCFPHGWVIQLQWGWRGCSPQHLLILVTRIVLWPAEAKYLEPSQWGEGFHCMGKEVMETTYGKTQWTGT